MIRKENFNLLDALSNDDATPSENRGKGRTHATFLILYSRANHTKKFSHGRKNEYCVMIKFAGRTRHFHNQVPVLQGSQPGRSIRFREDDILNIIFPLRVFGGNYHREVLGFYCYLILTQTQIRIKNVKQFFRFNKYIL